MTCGNIDDGNQPCLEDYFLKLKTYLMIRLKSSQNTDSIDFSLFLMV